jgi:hypothetical protein
MADLLKQEKQLTYSWMYLQPGANSIGRMLDEFLQPSGQRKRGSGAEMIE